MGTRRRAYAARQRRSALRAHGPGYRRAGDGQRRYPVPYAVADVPQVPAVVQHGLERERHRRSALLGIAHADPAEPEQHAAEYELLRSVGAERLAGQSEPAAVHV